MLSGSSPMKILVTGSAGHLGEALMRCLRDTPHQAVGVDVQASPFTDAQGSVADRAFVARHMRGVNAVIHAATLHKPHVATHSRQNFVDTNITGTLNLLEEAAAQGVGSFVFTSTTSTFGHALTPPEGAPAAWITEQVVPVPKNIYGVTKVAAEDLCELFFRLHRLPCVVLRTSRFFPEGDDDEAVRLRYDDTNTKVNELLYRRVDIQDVVDAHLLAMEKAPRIGFDRYIISATSPFDNTDAKLLRSDAPAVVARHVPQYMAEYQRRQWSMFPHIDRIYVNHKARTELGWQPRHDFRTALGHLCRDEDYRSVLTLAVGSKGYHPPGLAPGSLV
jgi:UDP-glucose 4-epimerase